MPRSNANAELLLLLSSVTPAYPEEAQIGISEPSFTTCAEYPVSASLWLPRAAAGCNIGSLTPSPLPADHAQDVLGNFPHKIKGEDSNCNVSQGYPFFANYPGQPSCPQSQEQSIARDINGATVDINYLNIFSEVFDQQTSSFGSLSQNDTIDSLTKYTNGFESFDRSIGDAPQEQFNSDLSLSGMGWTMALSFPCINSRAPFIAQPIQSMHTALDASSNSNNGDYEVGSFGASMGGRSEQSSPSLTYAASTGNIDLPFPNDGNHAPSLAQPAQTIQAAVAPAQQQNLVLCTQFPCPMSFKRHADRIRHEATVHGVNQVLHLCRIPGCSKGQGRGYSRADKLTEHMWKKHGNMGYVKRT